MSFGWVLVGYLVLWLVLVWFWATSGFLLGGFLVVIWAWVLMVFGWWLVGGFLVTFGLLGFVHVGFVGYFVGG